MPGGGGRRAWMRRVGVLVLAGVVLVVVVAVRWRLDADPNRAFLSADAAFKAGRHAEADAALNRLERLRRPTSVNRLLRAEVAQGLKQPDRALAELAAIPDDDVVAPLARLRAGQIEIRRGRTRPAEAALRASLDLFPRGVQPRKELVYIYNIQHRQAELDATLAELLELDSLDFAYILHWTKTRNTVWNPNGDLPALEKFVAADAEDRWSRLALAEALRRLDRLDEADRMLAPLPASDPEARVERVQLAMDRGDFAAAEALLAGGPDDHPGLARLRGQLALQRREGEAAARQFRIAVAADPTDRLPCRAWGPRWRCSAVTPTPAPTWRPRAATTPSGPWSPAPRPPRGRTIPICPTSSAWPARPSAATWRPGPGSSWPSAATRPTPRARGPSSSSSTDRRPDPPGPRQPRTPPRRRP